MLVLQIVIKQWDKSQRTAAHVLERSGRPDSYPIIFPPAFYMFNKRCVIDQRGDDRQGGRIKYAQMADGKIQFDRFSLNIEEPVLEYIGVPRSDNTPSLVGVLNNQWLQCKYTDRHSVFEGGFYYWLYEEVTLNAICIDEFNESVFINAEPALVFTDVSSL